MLPTRTSLRVAAAWVLFHSVATGVVALVLTLDAALGIVYLLLVLPATLYLLWRSYQLLVTPHPQQAQVLFMTSNVYLTVILIAICVAGVYY